MTPTNLCVRCDWPINEHSDSEEHVIPNSIGGRLKVRGFICASCNNSTGETWDAALAKQLNFFCHFFGIVRERGNPPPQPIMTTAGEHLLMQHGGGYTMRNPVYRSAQTEHGKQIQIVARDRREAEKMLKDVARKYPNQIDIAAELAKATESYTYPEGVQFHSSQIGGDLGGRSTVKTATAFAFHCRVPLDRCDMAIAYLRDEAAESVFGYYDETDLVDGRPAGVPIHCVAVAGDPATGMLLGYVEYFGIWRVVVCLSQSYIGPPLARSYGLDPTNGETIALQVKLPFSAGDIRAIYDYKKCSDEGMQRAFEEVVPTALRRHFEREKGRVIKDAVQYAFENCGAKPEDVLTDEQIRRLAVLAVERMMPFMSRHAPQRPLRRQGQAKP